MEGATHNTSRMNWRTILTSFVLIILAYFASVSSAALTSTKRVKQPVAYDFGAINRDGLTSPQPSPPTPTTNVFSKTSTLGSAITDGIKSILGTKSFHRIGRAAFGQLGLDGTDALKVHL